MREVEMVEGAEEGAAPKKIKIVILQIASRF
jgi:hypothetical protein